MTIDQWRQNRALTKWWDQVLSTPQGREFLTMMEESHLRHIQNVHVDNGVQLGRIYGYDICLNNVRAAAEITDAAADPGPPTYEPDETESRQKREKTKKE